jgi:hypothetical protein
VVDLGFESQQKEIFPFSRMSRPAVRSTQPPIQWVPVLMSMKLTTHLHLVSRLMNEAWSPYMPSWPGQEQLYFLPSPSPPKLYMHISSPPHMPHALLEETK